MKAKEREELLQTLQARFEKNMRRHKGVAWAEVQRKLEGNSDTLRSLHEMEATGGEPDVISEDKKAGTYTFCDCSAQSPSGRRSLCYDKKALDSRKENKPAGSAVAVAAAMGVELLTEEQYRELQTLGEFDTKTSSWVVTPPDVRALGGALFCDRRYDTVFVYHNGAESYYAARGFRASHSRMKTESKFAARVFWWGGIYGILILAPQYLLESGLVPALPGPITRPEHFYGFVGVALVWQFAFLVIARDVRRFRPLMLIGVLEKLAFGLPVLLLYARGRIGLDVLVFGCIDLLLGVLFILAYRATPGASATAP